MTTLAQHLAQVRAAWREAVSVQELDEREDECLRMFGLDVAYIHDERIILDPRAVQGMDSTMGNL